ncbi:MAG: Clp1/GlmU family protein [Nitrospiraceae bacterium]|nr:Clp1/GlmU family protein [Nitrospiraceae bacterium]
MKSETIAPAKGWERLVGQLLRRRATAVLLGASDSGKSTLARYLLENLLEKSASVCLVDSDVGQSSLGFPAVIASRLFRGPEDLGRYWPQMGPPGGLRLPGVGAMFFIGTVNPAKSIARMIYGTGKMAALCGRKGADVTLVDTTGLVSGRAGRALKLGKIRLLRPAHIIAIEKNGELEHILSALRQDGLRFSLHRLRPSNLARVTSRRDRIRYREGKFREYFRQSDTVKFPTGGVGLYRGGRPFALAGGEAQPGCLVGLNRGEDTLGLGIFKRSDASGVFVRTPLSLRLAKRVDGIAFGEVVIEDEDDGCGG